MWNICIENFDAGKQEQATRLLHCSGNHMCVNTLSWLMKLKKKKRREEKSSSVVLLQLNLIPISKTETSVSPPEGGVSSLLV